MTQPVRKAVFPVAGLGTRFLPATKAMPKEMLPVVDKPLIQYAVEEAAAAGVEEFVFVTSRNKSLLEDHFDHHEELVRTLENRGKKAELAAIESYAPPMGRMYFTRQGKPLGLGHAIWCARSFIGDEPFAIVLPDELVLNDVPCLAQLAAVYEREGGNVIAVNEVPPEQTNRYGILETGTDDGRVVEVRGLVEKPDPKDAPSTLSITGRYILQPEVFEPLSAHRAGAGGEIQLTDAMAQLIGKQPFHGVRFDGVRYDCGDKAGFVAANLAFALARDDLSDAVRRAATEILKRG